MRTVNPGVLADHRSLAQLLGPIVVFASMTPFRGGTFFAAGSLVLIAGAALCLAALALQVDALVAVVQRSFIVPLLTYAALSTIWSIDRGATLNALIPFAAATFIGAYLSIRVPHENRFKVLINAMLAALLLSVVADLFVPQLRAVGNLRVGIFEHKNALGRASTILVLCLLLENLALGTRRRTAIPVAIFAFGYVASSGAGTATIAIAVLLLLLLLTRVPSRHYEMLRTSYALPALLLGAALAIGSFFALIGQIEERLLGVLGRSSSANTLEVRRSLWRLIFDDVRERPTFGHGYGTLNFQDIEVFTGRYYATWQARQAHNGFIDVLYQLGAAGIGLLVIHIWVVGFRCRALRPRLRATYWVYTALLLAVNLTYSASFGMLSVFWILHIVVLTTIFDANET